VSQNDDIQNVANKANSAADGAYTAQLTNEEQDEVLREQAETLQDHENRIDTAELTLLDHEQRITSNTGRLDIAEPKIDQLQLDVGNLDSRVGDIELDYVSKSDAGQQSLSGSLSVLNSYSVNGVKVVGVRNTGWVAAGGTVAANKGVWNPNTLAPASAVYSQAEASAVRSQLNAAEARIKALEQMIRTHGLID
jgi:hypothetical protein